MRRNSGIIGPTKSIGSEIDTKNGIYDTFDAYNHKLHDVWPYTQKLIGFSLSPGTTVAEGSSLSIDCLTSGVLDGELLYYSVNTVSGPTMTNADFVDGLTGSFEIIGNNGSAILTGVPGDGTESNTFNVDIRKGSISGDIFATTSTITLTDVADVVGQTNFLVAGTYNWTCPAGVLEVSALAIGGGGGGIAYSCCSYAMMGGAGGGLGWRNAVSVTAGTSYTVVVGSGGINGAYSSGSQSGGDSYFINSGIVKGGGGRYGRYAQDTPASTFTGDGGGAGGGSDYVTSSGYGPGGGGGAGGYSGNGGTGRHTTYGTGVAGSGGGAGGNGGSGTSSVVAYSGGGVGIYGEGSSGNSSGGGGSGGSSGGSAGAGVYGGGGGGATSGYNNSKPGKAGAVRLIWGSGRAYPSTLTTDQ